MSSRNRRDDWLDDDEYPDERDMEQFGDGSPGDSDPLIIGRVRRVNTRFWTRKRIIIALIALTLLIVFLIGELWPVINP